MTDLQARLLDMVLWFHEICEENDLRYYALGGTALGAMRHKGFIPWDDDIDVGMPRADYEKFCRIMQGFKHEHYLLETSGVGNHDYFYPYAKIYDTRTTLVENTRLRIKRGVFLDVFPLDGIGNSEKEIERNYRHIQWKRNLLLTRVTGVREGRSKVKNLAVILAGLVPNKILDDKKILLSLEKDCKKCDFDACRWVGNLVGAWGTRELMPRELFGKPILCKFEGYDLYIPQKADEYLSALYGDWRKLPPIEKQVSHHDFIMCDLDKSYLDE